MLRVRAADGYEWTIRRRLRIVPPRWRGFGNLPDPDTAWLPDLGGSSGLSDVLFGIALLVFLAVLIVFLLPLFAFVGEAVLLGLAAAAIGGTWTVEARSDGPPARTGRWQARGWRASRRLMADVRERLETSGLPPTETLSGGA
jgi:hypothetical protein